MLETDRLLLCPWRVEDRDAFRPIASDPEVMRYITGGTPWSDEQIDEFIQRQIRAIDEHGYCFWRLLRKQQPERLIGFCGLKLRRDRPGFVIGYDGVVEIGWWLAPDCWGQGFATEAARVALGYGFDQAGLEKIIAITDRDNKASQRVAGRIGLTFERAVPLETREIWVFSGSSRRTSPRTVEDGPASTGASGGPKAHPAPG